MPDAAWLDDERLVFGSDAGLQDARSTRGAWVLDLRDGSRTPLAAGLSGPLTVSDDRRFAALSRVPPNAVSSVEIYRVETLLGSEPERAVRFPKEGFFTQPNLVALAGDGAFLVVARGVQLRSALTLEVFHRESGRRIFTQEMKFPVTGVAVHPDQTRLAVASADSAVRSYDFHRESADAMHEISPPGKPAGSYDDGTFPAIREPLDGHGALDPPRQFLTRSALEGGVAFLLGHEDRVTGVTFTPDGRALASVSADGTLRLWDQGVPRAGIRLGPVNSWYFGLIPSASADGRRVLLHQWDHQAHWHDVAAGRDVRTATDQCPLAVLSDGRFLTQHGRTGGIVAWEAGASGTRANYGALPGHWFLSSRGRAAGCFRVTSSSSSAPPGAFFSSWIWKSGRWWREAASISRPGRRASPATIFRPMPAGSPPPVSHPAPASTPSPIRPR